MSARLQVSDAVLLVERLIRARRAVGWNVAQAARAIGAGEPTWRSWEVGDTPAPADVVRWLEELAAAHGRVRPPVWRIRSGTRRSA